MSKHVTLKAAWTGEANCHSCKLRESVLFSGLQVQDFEKIHDPIDQLDVQPGGYLYRAGETAKFLYTIRSGMVKLVQYLPDGKQRIVRLLKSTDITGLEAVVCDSYHHDAIAIYPTEVCALPSPVIKKLAAENQGLHREMMSRWGKALKTADSWITHLSTGNAVQRVARLLLFHLCSDDDHTCILPLRDDVAAILGITTETASRTIADFKRQGIIIEIERQSYRIDRDKAEAAAE